MSITTDDNLDLAFVAELIDRLGRGRENLIRILQQLQEHYGYLPQAALRRVCELSEITPAEIAGVATFYNQFRHRPVGEHLIRVCHGTACHIKGAPMVTETLHKHLAIPPGDDTDPDGVFTVGKVACLGCCTLAPVVAIGELTYGHVTPDRVPGMLEDYLQLQSHPPAPPPGYQAEDGDHVAEIRLGLGSCCVARGSGNVRRALDEVLAGTHLAGRIKRVGCVGMCHQTPLLEIVPAAGPSHLYARVTPEDARSIVLRHLRPRGLHRRVASAVGRGLDRLLTDQGWGGVQRYALDVRDAPVSAFLGPQRHLATEHCGVIDPTDLDEYLARDGFRALRRAVTEMSPQRVIDEVTASGLRGRGGAGFPTGRKWSLVRAAAGADKYVICNADEGDPGAFMDRMLLESYPYRVIEGLAVAGFATGATRGTFYIRAEYPLAVLRVGEALDRCRQKGLLGEDILGSGVSLDVRIMEGAGAFVCGEETALLASIEGRRGMPRLRPPYPADAGLWGKPTLVNNVETYAVVPWILRNGAGAFAALGTEKSKGTKVFALAGKVARGGLIEVPMGVTVREVVERIGGGAAGGKAFKAVQIGGPSGGCVPARLGDTPIDYEALAAAGAIMGSGGLVVLDEDDCMVDIARYFLEFTQDQSCGKCAPCRVGTRRMLSILTRLCEGGGKAGDLDELAGLARLVKSSSLCGLGKTAPNPVLSTLEYFRDEYEAHIAGTCPAGVCKALIRYVVTDDCIGCTLCAQQCPADAIAMTPYEKHQIDPEKCVRCGNCKRICPADAVRVE
ncbi:MAG TPA: NADH-quinone oxidoreductase subunit NuoE [Phycisphaerae bacterium]|nr:NADH-quinone oxidoreductase subunit NuoE [Phycisphaerae bacterium]